MEKFFDGDAKPDNKKTELPVLKSVFVIVPVLNVRSAPNIESEVIGILRQCDVQDIVKVINGWGKLKDQKGWILLEHTVYVVR